MRTVRGLALALSIIAAPLGAQSAVPTVGKSWNDLARIDVAAALELIETNHPGAAPELGDVDFQALLRAARANAERRLPSVRDYYGHAALLSGLANDFRDGHIWSNPVLSSSRRTWAGLIMARRGGHWVVGAQKGQPGEPELQGSRLVACDGIDAASFAAARTGTFYAHPGVEADMAGLAYTLLLDDKNPFVARARTCRFLTSDGKTIDHRLNWRPIGTRNLEKLIGDTQQPAAAGMALTPFAGGQWIGVETFSNAAAAVVAQVRAQQDVLRSAPMVVLDLRGNSGGNSQYAVEIAAALVGDARAAAAERSGGTCTGTYWRVSPGNASALKNFAAELPADRAPEWLAEAEALDRAVKDKRIFSPDLPACARTPPSAPRPATLPPSAMKGRLVLLTDRACFSSCLIAADLFRRIGALHVGEATDMSTRFMEVREILLPSGLRTFSTLQKVALGTGNYGPYVPTIAYPGALSDDAAVKAWVAALPL